MAMSNHRRWYNTQPVEQFRQGRAPQAGKLREVLHAMGVELFDVIRQSRQLREFLVGQCIGLTLGHQCVIPAPLGLRESPIDVLQESRFFGVKASRGGVLSLKRGPHGVYD